MWHKPLLWVLWLGYSFLVPGLAMPAMAVFWWTNPFLGLHALTYSGIGPSTLGMMARSRSATPGPMCSSRRRQSAGCALLGAGTVVRVLLVLPASCYGSLIVAFGRFVSICGPMLVLRRVDGRYG